MATATEATDKPNGSQDQQPSTFTIPKGDACLPKGMEQWQTGDQVMIPATIQAIDDAGVTFATSGEITKESETPAEDKGEGGEGGENAQVDYVSGKRREMMAE